MSIQVNAGASAVNWETLLNKIGDVQKTQGADGKETLTVTVKAADGSSSFTFGVPDDLEPPDIVDQAAINSLCAKLAADKDLFNMTDADIATLKTALTTALAQVAPGVTKESKSVMFDLYKLMALLVEVAQKQRDASREMRQVNSMQVQLSIQQQAELQRTAAVTSMIASVACCALQVGFSAFSIYKQGKAYDNQAATSDGVRDARAQLSEHLGEIKKYETDHWHGAEVTELEGGVTRTRALTAEQRQAKIAELKLQVATDKENVLRARDLRSTDAAYVEASRQISKYDALNNIVSAMGQVAQNFIQNTNALIQANASEKSADQTKAQEELDQTKDLFNQAQTLIDEVVKLMNAVSQAETQSMRDAIQA
jgi:hypothetical protein